MHRFLTLCRSNGGVLKVVWFLIVALGFILTFFMAFLVRSDWNDALTSTSVLQIPIEQIIFPAVTICPLGSDSLIDDLTESGAKHKLLQVQEFLLSVHMANVSSA